MQLEVQKISQKEDNEKAKEKKAAKEGQKEENKMLHLKKLTYLILTGYRFDSYTLKLILACLNATKIHTLK